MVVPPRSYESKEDSNTGGGSLQAESDSFFLKDEWELTCNR